MMMALGVFIFGLPTLAYRELQRSTEWRHGSTSRIGTNPASQFLGRGRHHNPSRHHASWPGRLPISLDVLRKMADTGKAWPLIGGTGRIYGIWVITSIGETQQIFSRTALRGGTSSRLASSGSMTGASTCSVA